MKRPIRTIFWTVGGVYAALIVVAAGNAIYQSRYDPAHSEFSGLPLIILALPWSMTLPTPPTLASTFDNSVLWESGYAAINACAFIALGFLLDRGAPVKPIEGKHSR